jgi:hypothetical protein
MTYNSAGKMLTNTSEQWVNDVWTNVERYTYVYDEHGNMLSWVYEVGSRSLWLKDERNDFAYDADGLVISFWHFTGVNDTWTPTDHSFETSDGAGNSYYVGECYNAVLSYRSVVTGVAAGQEPGPTSFSMSQNYPNPFNPSTTIGYSLPARSHVTLTVFNTLGQRVAVLQNGEQAAGHHETVFNAQGLPSGVYFYRLSAGSFTETRRLLLVR